MRSQKAFEMTECNEIDEGVVTEDTTEVVQTASKNEKKTKSLQRWNKSTKVKQWKNMLEKTAEEEKRLREEKLADEERKYAEEKRIEEEKRKQRQQQLMKIMRASFDLCYEDELEDVLEEEEEDLLSESSDGSEENDFFIEEDDDEYD